VGLADVYIVSDLPDPREAMIRAKAAAKRALEIDGNLAEAHTTLAFADMFEWNWEAAERGFLRALELNPSYAPAPHWYALFLSWNGRHEEAVAQIEFARALDPLSLAIDNEMGNILFWARRYDEAIEHHLQTFAIDENFVRAHKSLGFAYLLKGMNEEALKEFQWVIENSGLPEDFASLGVAYTMMGKKDEVETILAKLHSLDKDMKLMRSISFELAQIYVTLGEMDNAIEHLSRAFAENSGEMAYLKVAPLFDPLRGDSRFQELMRRLNFPDID